MEYGTMSPSIRIGLLGPCECFRAGQPVALSTHQSLLIGLFIMKDTRVLSRCDVAGLLWPRRSARRSRHSLSQALYSMSKLTGRENLIRSAGGYLYLQQIAVDVEEMRLAIDAADWVLAASLIRGAFLEGVNGSCQELDELLAFTRARYAELALSVADQLRLDALGNVAASVVSRLPPQFREGKVSAKITSREPSCTHAMGAIRPDPTANTFGFVGREREMQWLEQQFQRVGGGFTTAIIEGEPGLGKTAIATRFARLRALRGTRVLCAKGFEAEQNVPFGVVAQWLKQLHPAGGSLGEPWFDIVEEAFPGILRPAETGTLSRRTVDVLHEYRLLEALRRIFALVERDMQLLLYLDDAQVADAASLGFIHYFARWSTSAPVLFLATVRTPSAHGSSTFAGWDGINVLRLAPFGLTEISLLHRRLAGSGHEILPAEIEGLWKRTGGNPLLVVSLLTSSLHGSVGEVPESVLNFFRPRLEALTKDAARLLAAIAISGESADINVAERVCGFDSTGVRMLVALKELHDAGLIVRESNEVVSPRHGIIAEVALSSLSGADKRSLYGRAARILAEEGRIPPSVLAVQHDIAGDRMHAYGAAVQAVAASRQLHATRECEFFLKLALSNAPGPTADAKIRIELADLFRHLGRPTEGLEIVADDVIAHAPRDSQLRARASRLAIELCRADIPYEVDDIWAEICVLADSIEPEAAAELYFLFAAAAHDWGRTANTIEAARRALVVAQSVPASPKSALVASRSASTLALYLGYEEGLEVIDGFLPTVTNDLSALSQCLWARGTVLIAAGRLIEAESCLLRGLQLMERCCLYGGLFGLLNNLGVCYIEQGRYPDAAEQLGEASRVGRQFLGLSGAAVPADNMAMLYFEQGEVASALASARAAMAPRYSKSSRWLFHRHGMIGLCSLELGLLAQAFEAKREIELLFDQHEYWSNDVSYVESFLARMLVLEDRAADARERLLRAIDVYRPRDLLCRARLELELVRLELKSDPRSARRRSEVMLAELRGSGARPLIDRFEGVADRANSSLRR